MWTFCTIGVLIGLIFIVAMLVIDIGMDEAYKDDYEGKWK